MLYAGILGREEELNNYGRWITRGIFNDNEDDEIRGQNNAHSLNTYTAPITHLFCIPLL